MAQYAVAKDGVHKFFTKIHFDRDEAHKEAERLCRLEGKPFLVIEILGRYSPVEAPVEYERLN